MRSLRYDNVDDEDNFDTDDRDRCDADADDSIFSFTFYLLFIKSINT